MQMKDFNTTNRNIDINVAEILNSFVELDADKREMMYFLFKSLYVLAKQQTELTQTAAAVLPELARIVPVFFERREEANLRALSPRKLAKFISNAEIHREATENAFEQTQKMIDMVSLIRDEGFRSLAANQIAMLQSIMQTMTALALENSTGQPRQIPKFIDAELKWHDDRSE